jgi:antitoxin HicB
MKLAYPATITAAEEGGFIVQFVDLPEAFSEGETLPETLANAEDVLSGVLELKLELEHDIPMPSKPKKNQYSIVPRASVQSAVLFHLNRNGKTLSEIARNMNTGFAAVKRLENPRLTPSLRQLEKAAHALGKKLILSLE